MLNDVKVLDLSRLLPGPFCSLLLADMHADVLKIEDGRGGDYARYYPPFVEDVGAFYASVNRNKRSMVLDLKQASGVELFKQLVQQADVVLESFRPGVMTRLGVGYETLKVLNPQLIYCAISGYGQTGDMAKVAGHDLNYMALSGTLSQNTAAGAKPHPLSVQVADIAGGALYAALGIVSALYQRERTGQGAMLDISMTDGALSFQLPGLATLKAGQYEQPGQGMLTGGLPCYRVYETADGLFYAVGALEPKFWIKLVSALDLNEYATDGLATGKRGEQVHQALEAKFKEKTRDQWTAVLAPLDACCEPVLSPQESLELSLFKTREMFFELSGVQHVRTPLTDPAIEHQPAPGLGEHTMEVLAELGLHEEAIHKLLGDGVVMG